MLVYIYFFFYNKFKGESIIMLDERTRKILLSIIKHCNIIEDTKIHFGNNYAEFEENSIYQNAILTPITQIGELVKRLPDEFRQKYTEIPWRILQV